MWDRTLGRKTNKTFVKIKNSPLFLNVDHVLNLHSNSFQKSYSISMILNLYTSYCSAKNNINSESRSGCTVAQPPMGGSVATVGGSKEVVFWIRSQRLGRFDMVYFFTVNSGFSRFHIPIKDMLIQRRNLKNQWFWAVWCLESHILDFHDMLDGESGIGML